VNRFSIARDERILSAYTLSTGVKVWVITEAGVPRRFCRRRSTDDSGDGEFSAADGVVSGRQVGRDELAVKQMLHW
jgi:hypothetical protein